MVAASWVSTWFCNIDVSVPELSKQRGLFKARLRRILFYLKQNIKKETFTFPFKGTVYQHFLNNPGLCQNFGSLEVCKQIYSAIFFAKKAEIGAQKNVISEKIHPCLKIYLP